MCELRERNQNIDGRHHTDHQDNQFTGRSMKSIQNGSFNNIHISPWSGEEIYCKVRKQIREQKQRKRSSTAKSMITRCGEKKVKPQQARLKTVQLEMMPFPNQIVKSQWSKLFQSKMSSQFLCKQPLREKSQKQQRCSTVSVNESQPIHQRKTSAKLIPQSKEKIMTSTSRPSHALLANPLFGKNDKRCLMFFFETKYNSNIVNREKMIMKIRNIERGKAQRMYTQVN